MSGLEPQSVLFIAAGLVDLSFPDWHEYLRWKPSIICERDLKGSLILLVGEVDIFSGRVLQRLKDIGL